MHNDAGNSWQDMIKGADKHWQDFKDGKDFYGGEYKGSNLDMAIRKLQILQRYHKTNPEGDDRPHPYLRHPKIGLDIDEVLAGWINAWTERFGLPSEVEFWNFDRFMYDRFVEMKDDKDFWLSIKPLILPKDLPFEPHCYITARSIPQAWTEEWLYDVAGFPHVPVYSVGFGVSKVETAKKSGVERFVDDSFKNFVELNKGGICTYLWDTPQNARYEVGYRRIKSLKEVL